MGKSSLKKWFNTATITISIYNNYIYGRTVAICSIFFFLTITGYTQQYNFENYSVDNGFPPIVYSIFQDSRGYLWLGTDGQGVCRFDSYNKIFYNKSNGLVGNTVRSVIEDKYYRLWFATDEGISIFDGVSFRSITEKDGLSSNTVVCLYRDNYDNIIAGTAGEKGGLNKIEIIAADSIKINVINTNNGLTVNSIFSIYQDIWNRYWVGTFGGGVNVLSNDLKNILAYYTSVDGFPSDYIVNFSSKDSNTLWAGTYDKGVIKISLNKNINNCKFEVLDPSQNKNINTTWAVLPSDEAIWYGTNLNGLVGIGKTNTININEQNGLTKNQVVDLFIDREKNLWISCFDGGISRFLGKKFITYTKKEAPFLEDVTCIKLDQKGVIWIGSYSNGLFAVELSGSKLIYKYIGLKNEIINSITVDNNNNKWIATTNGIYKYNDFVFTNYCKKNSGIINNTINFIFADINNSIWCGTPMGISVFAENKFINTKDGYLPNTEIQTIIEDKKRNIWCGTLGGLVKFHNDSLVFYDEKEGLFQKKIYSLALDEKDNLWIGTFGGGVYKFQRKSKEYQVDTLIPLSINNLLTSLNIFSLQFINDSTLLVGTDKGLNKLILNYDESVRSVSTYSSNNGFVGVKCNPNAIALINNNVWIGTSKGVTIYNPYIDIPNNTIPTINITNIKLFFKEINWEKEGFEITPWNNLPKKLVLEYSKNHLTFEFSGILFSDKNNVKYRYKLEGLDKEWSPPSEKREALYSSLSHGTYTFKVIASNKLNQWSNPAEFQFTIRPPFWKSIWFYISVSVLGIAIIIIYIKYRERKLRKDRDRLEHIVEERTKEVVEQKKEITESIEYAKRLQSAIIPSDDLLDKTFADSFILYKPKDIVSGDFYWYGNYNDKIIIIAADCTGHGVPGAFMSMLGVSLINKIIAEEKTTSPDEILNKLRYNIIKSLKQNENNNLQDGMDMVVLSFNRKLTELEFCGANNPIFIVRNNEFFDCIKDQENFEIKSDTCFLKELKPNKMPVSISRKMEPFSKETIKLWPNDKIYIFSDGYSDQIGGPYNKKFMKKQLKEILLKINNLKMTQQKEFLNEKCIEWIGKGKQLDDIMIIGIEIK